MPIERKDRSFEKIFSEVTLGKVPMEYVDSIKVTLIDGTEIELDQDYLSEIPADSEGSFGSIHKDDILDVAISLDYEAIKGDITREVTNFMSDFFSDTDKDDEQ